MVLAVFGKQLQIEPEAEKVTYDILYPYQITTRYIAPSHETY